MLSYSTNTRIIVSCFAIPCALKSMRNNKFLHYIKIWELSVSLLVLADIASIWNCVTVLLIHLIIKVHTPFAFFLSPSFFSQGSQALNWDSLRVNFIIFRNCWTYVELSNRSYVTNVILLQKCLNNGIGKVLSNDPKYKHFSLLFTQVKWKSLI